MAEDEHYTGVDISDVIDDTDQFADPDNPETETYEIEMENHPELDSEAVYSEEQASEEIMQAAQTPKSDIPKSTKLPIARIKHIMKMDPDVNIVHNEAAFLVTKATEQFLALMAKETYSFLQKNRKTINKKELDIVINRVDCLCFLEGAMDF